jgi:xylan 1,4-beta-xylosidase
VERFDSDSPNVLITRRTDGTFVIALWNFAPPGSGGPSTTVTLRLPPGAVSARVLRLDAAHGDAGGEYVRMGSPKYPTPAQRQALIDAAVLPAAEDLPIRDERISVILPANGLATVEVILKRP